MRKFWDEEAFNKLSETNLEAARITEVMNDEKWRVPLRKFLEVEGGAPLDTFNFWIQAALWRNQPCDTGESEVIYRLMVAQLWHDFIDNSATLTPAAGISDETPAAVQGWAAGLPRPEARARRGQAEEAEQADAILRLHPTGFHRHFQRGAPDPGPDAVLRRPGGGRRLWLAREVGVEWWPRDGGVKVSAAREERKRRADKEFVAEAPREREGARGRRREGAQARGDRAREDARGRARVGELEAPTPGSTRSIEQLITDASLNSAHLEREWAVAAMASRGGRRVLRRRAVKEVFNDMLVDAISEETLERLEEEYFGDGLDELVPMLQDAHVLSEHWPRRRKRRRVPAAARRGRGPRPRPLREGARAHQHRGDEEGARRRRDEGGRGRGRAPAGARAGGEGAPGRRGRNAEENRGRPSPRHLLGPGPGRDSLHAARVESTQGTQPDETDARGHVERRAWTQQAAQYYYENTVSGVGSGRAAAGKLFPKLPSDLFELL